MLFKVQNIQLVGCQKFKGSCNEDCTICRVSLNSDSIYAIEKNFKSTLKSGTCGHYFHTECINEWLKKNLNCPICNCNFVQNKI